MGVILGAGKELLLQATTGTGGYALVNGTGTIFSWTPPNDGLLHRFIIPGIQTIGVQEVGGTININFTAPDGTACGWTVWNNGQAPTQNFSQVFVQGICKANTAVVLSQASALTSGSATLWCELWGS